MKTKFYQRHDSAYKPVWVIILFIILAICAFGIWGCGATKYGCPSTQKLSGYHRK